MPAQTDIYDTGILTPKLTGNGQALSRGRATIDCTAGGTITATAAVYENDAIDLTGAPGAGITIILPLTDGASWRIYNATGQTATIEGPTGTSTTVSTTKRRRVETDGTNFYAQTAEV